MAWNVKLALQRGSQQMGHGTGVREGRDTWRKELFREASNNDDWKAQLYTPNLKRLTSGHHA